MKLRELLDLNDAGIFESPDLFEFCKQAELKIPELMDKDVAFLMYTLEKLHDILKINAALPPTKHEAGWHE